MISVDHIFFLGIKTIHDDTSMVLSQQRYMRDILCCAAIEKCKPLATPVPVTVKSGVSNDAAFDDPTRYPSLVGAL